MIKGLLASVLAKADALLELVMILVVEDHAFAKHFDRIEINQHDWLAARCADMFGLMVDNFAVRQRGARCL